MDKPWIIVYVNLDTTSNSATIRLMSTQPTEQTLWKTAQQCGLRGARIRPGNVYRYRLRRNRALCFVSGKMPQVGGCPTPARGIRG